MERRLTSAYDSMTMPERCSSRIEQSLQQQLRMQQLGSHVRAVKPMGRPRGRETAAALVFLVLALVLSGALLRFRGSETPLWAAPEETAGAPGDYSLETSLDPREVENFAKIVRHNVLTENWDALSEKICYPVTVQDQTVEDKAGLVLWMEALWKDPAIREAMTGESCTNMFCSDQGICMAEGFLWIRDVAGVLKIAAVNEKIREEAPAEDQRKEIPEAFAEILSGDQVKMAGVLKDLTLAEYCTQMQEDGKPDAFAVVDMDSDGICELVISLTNAQDEQAGHMVLRQAGDEICGYPFQAGEILDLKKDGTFFRRDREHRMIFREETGWSVLEVLGQQERPPAQWHSYPCRNPELLLRSYEHVTGTGWSIFPGYPYYLFEGLAMERTGNTADVLEHWLQSAVCVREGNVLYLFDPDAPGTAFYGTLTEGEGFALFSQVGYYISAEEREYQGEIRNMLAEEPEYWADVHLAEQPVSTPEELAAYFGYTPLPAEEVLQENRAIREAVEGFMAAWTTGEPGALEPYLAESDPGQIPAAPGDTLELLTYGTLPGRVMAVGETCSLGANLRLAGEGSFWYNMDLVKQEEGWKVQAFRLQKYQ